MIYTGVTASGEFSLSAPAQVSYDSSEDAPADSFTGVFPICKSPGNVTEIHIYSESGEMLFDGVTDIQKEISGERAYLSLTARNRAGLLLDSEPLPQNYTYPSLPVIFRRHIKPYGFTAFRGNDRSYDGKMLVTKGMSEWQVAAAFCKRFLLVTPRVRGSVFDASGETPQNEILFDNSSGVRYSSIERKTRYCDYLSELFALSEKSGSYVSAQQDSETAALGITRNRYLSKSGINAFSVMKNIRHNAFSVTLDCPEEIPIQLYAPAAVNDPLFGAISGLYAAKLHYSLSSGGEHCLVTLRNK